MKLLNELLRTFYPKGGRGISIFVTVWIMFFIIFFGYWYINPDFIKEPVKDPYYEVLDSIYLIDPHTHKCVKVGNGIHIGPYVTFEAVDPRNCN